MYKIEINYLVLLWGMFRVRTVKVVYDLLQLSLWQLQYVCQRARAGPVQAGVHQPLGALPVPAAHLAPWLLQPAHGTSVTPVTTLRDTVVRASCMRLTSGRRGR